MSMVAPPRVPSVISVRRAPCQLRRGMRASTARREGVLERPQAARSGATAAPIEPLRGAPEPRAGPQTDISDTLNVQLSAENRPFAEALSGKTLLQHWAPLNLIY